MMARRHHNNKGYRQIKTGGTARSLERIAKKLGVANMGYETFYEGDAGELDGPPRSLLAFRDWINAEIEKIPEAKAVSAEIWFVANIYSEVSVSILRETK